MSTDRQPGEPGAEDALERKKRELARHLLRKRKLAAARPAIAPRPGDTGDLPLSFAQERLWFLDQLAPDNVSHNMPAAIRLTGDLDARALENTFREIVRRHEALRTTFTSRDGRPVQSIAPSIDLIVPVIDLTRLPEEKREAEAGHLADREARRRFDLARDLYPSKP